MRRWNRMWVLGKLGFRSAVSAEFLAGLGFLWAVMAAISAAAGDVGVFLTIGPALLAGFLVSAVAGVDWDEGSAELVGVCPISLWQPLGMRAFWAMTVAVLYVLVGLGFFFLRLGVDATKWLNGLPDGLRAAWFLGGLACLAAVVAGTSAAGMGAAAGYWLFEMLSKGSVTGLLYLFGTQHYRPCCVRLDPLWNSRALWLAGGCLWALALSMFCAGRVRRGFVSGRGIREAG